MFLQGNTNIFLSHFITSLAPCFNFHSPFENHTLQVNWFNLVVGISYFYLQLHMKQLYMKYWLFINVGDISLNVFCKEFMLLEYGNSGEV